MESVEEYGGEHPCEPSQLRMYAKVQEVSMARIKLIFLLIVLLGCAGTKPQVDDVMLQSWVGVWRGVAIVEGTNDPPDEWILSLTKDHSRLRGRISSKQGLFVRVPIEQLRVSAGELRFKFSYETSRGLRAIFENTAIREGHRLLSVFEGGEGGRAFRGRWEARYEP